MKAQLATLQANTELLQRELQLGRVLQVQLAKIQGGATDAVALARRQTYLAGIISIYALFEQSLDDIIAEVVALWPNIYRENSQVDESIRAKLRELTLESLLDTERGRGRHKMDLGQALASLQHGSQDSPIYEPTVALRRTANYRHQLAQSMFARVGVQFDGVFEAQRLEAVLEATPFAQIEKFIEDLVDRRNEIAHRVISPDADLLGVEGLQAYLKVTETYLTEFLRVASWRLIEQVLPRLGKLGTCREAGDRYVAFDLQQDRVSVGDELAFVRDRRLSILTVASIEMSHKGVEAVAFEGEPLDVGMAFVEGQRRQLKGADIFWASDVPMSVVCSLALNPLLHAE